MSLTVLLYRTTPFELDTEEELLEHLLMVKFCHNKEFAGTAQSSEIKHNGTDGKHLTNYPHGRLVQINDETHHTDDLWVICLNVDEPERRLAKLVMEDIILNVGCTAKDVYLVKDNVVMQFDGGASFYRTAFAASRRKRFQAV